MRWSTLSRAASISEGARELVEGSDQVLWSRVLLGRHPDGALEHLQATGVLRSTFPELQAMVGFGGHGQGHKDLWAHVKQVVLQSRPELAVRWAALFHDVGKVETFSRQSGKVSFHQHEYASARLLLRASRRSGLLGPDVQWQSHFLVRHLGLLEAYAPEWSDSAVRRLTKELGEHFERTLTLARADITTKHPDRRQRYHARLQELATRAADLAALDATVPPLPKGLGDALMTAFAIPPSKRLAELKAALEQAVHAGRAQPHQGADYYVSFLSEHREEFGLGKPPEHAS
jgi:poly(A) polymerase